MNVTDCHFHIFGPLKKYTPSSQAVYKPPNVTVKDYQIVQKRLGITRGVVVQASAQGYDNSCILDAAKKLGDFRAIVVVPSNIDRKSLEKLHARGARGIRIISAKPGGLSFSDIPILAEKIKDLGWHLEFYTEGLDLPHLEKYLKNAPVPCVLDHMGYIPAALGMNHPLFQMLFQLVERENIWIKWIGYRCSEMPFPYHDVEPLAEKLLEIAPDRLIWGTDYPHTNITKKPDDLELLQLFHKWISHDPELAKKILVKNPEILYGF